MNALISLLLVSILLFCFEWQMVSLIDWLVYVTIIWIIFLSMKVAHAKNGSTVPQNSSLTPGLSNIMFGGA